MLSVLNVKAVVAAFNQEKALVEAFSVIVKTDGCFAALLKILRELSAVTGPDHWPAGAGQASSFREIVHRDI